MSTSATIKFTTDFVAFLYQADLHKRGRYAVA